jgi:hypothetical protein
VKKALMALTKATVIKCVLFLNKQGVRGPGVCFGSMDLSL